MMLDTVWAAQREVLSLANFGVETRDRQRTDSTSKTYLGMERS